MNKTHFFAKIFTFVLLTFSTNFEIIQSYQSVQTIAIDPFEQKMHELLQGNKETSLVYGKDQDLFVKIQFKHNKKDYYYITFSALNDSGRIEEGIRLFVFPTQGNGYISYLQYIERISEIYNGTRLLEDLSDFCKEMCIRKIILEDQSEIVSELGDISLQKSHILTSPDHTSWYESKGFETISNETLLDRVQFHINQDLTPFLEYYFEPIPFASYRHSAENFADLKYWDYLQSIEQISLQTGLYRQDASNLQRIFKKYQFIDSTFTFGEVLKKLKKSNPAIQQEVMQQFKASGDEHFGEDESISNPYFLWVMSHRNQISSDVVYAMLVKIQMELRNLYNFQTKKDRSKLIQNIVGFLEGNDFTYKRDLDDYISVYLDDIEIIQNENDDEFDDDFDDFGFDDFEEEEDDDDWSDEEDDESDDDDDDDDEEHQFTVLALHFLAETPVQLILEHSNVESQQVLTKILENIEEISPTDTVAKVALLLDGEQQEKFLEEILFGTPSSEHYYGFVNSYIEQLMSSGDAHKFFIGHLLNLSILNDGNVMELNLFKGQK